jgi:hypothetical protein
MVRQVQLQQRHDEAVIGTQRLRGGERALVVLT